ncbi:23S rRNA (uracil(1939)-C(5))-methyltransferase RlmD [Synechococcus sp. MIT S9503]|uniref:23S rRNA (uracil(1939)-C(5))-methyltransferase RlmD n=1 Tax=Synechococcus sp. MIT S9503 TaxID=3082547 RepID=UPI0039A66D53
MPAMKETPHPGLTIDVVGEDLDQQGRGLARWNGWVITVPQLLPGEEAKVKVQQRQRKMWLARRVATISSSPDARRPPCILASDCGGCSLQHLSVDAQNSWKQQRLANTLSRIGQLDPDVNALVSPDRESLGYRNRALIPIRRDGRKVRLGYYKRGSHRIVNLNHCPVLDPRLDALIEPIKRDLEATSWPMDSDLQGEPGLRHLGLRIGVRTGEILITLISATESLQAVDVLSAAWMRRWPQLKGVTINLQPKRSNAVFGDRTICLQGQDAIEERFCGLSLELGTTTFFQVNTPRAERVVEQIRDWITRSEPSQRLIDAYCGIGTIALPLAAAGHRVTGLEISSASVRHAERNAARNRLKHTRFMSGDVARHLRELLPNHDALVVDPPRKGLDPAVLAMVLDYPPRRLVYLSCDPATLARDLRQLAGDSGPYTIEQVQPMDFFPQTSHLECLVLMSRISCAAPP